MKIDFNDSKTRIIALAVAIGWTLLLIILSISIYRQLFVLPWKGVIRDAGTKNFLNLDEIGTSEQNIVKNVYELANMDSEERGEAWQLIVDALNKEGDYVSPLDGKVFLDNTKDTSLFAVMIENSPEVMDKQSALEDASVVWHYPTEGAIGRLMAIFRASDVKHNIVPVRSTRPYYLDIANTFVGIPLVHAGGSTKALQILPTTSIFDIDEGMYGVTYRDINYYAPHNLFIDSAKMLSLMQEKNIYVNLPESLFSFSDSIVADAKIDTVTLNSLVTPKVEYTWKTNHFERTQEGKQTQNSDRDPLKITNVVILSSVVTDIPGDDQGRVDVQLVNNSKAKVLRGGQAFDVDFYYDFQSKTYSFTVNGENFDLIPGQTWVEVIPGDATIEIRDMM